MSVNPSSPVESCDWIIHKYDRFDLSSISKCRPGLNDLNSIGFGEYPCLDFLRAVHLPNRPAHWIVFMEFPTSNGLDHVFLQVS